MNSYILIIFADILLAAVFCFQKKYQKSVGTAMRAGLVYNALMGLFSALMFLVINRFEIRLSAYSLGMAAIFATVVVLYIFVGFSIMEKGNMALYTMFLMSGGMIVPYVWGLLFLDEPLTIYRALGLVLIIAAVVISNSGAKKPDLKTILMCIAVFFLNGISSVTSKMHQINPVSEYVESTDFAFLVMTFKAVICFVVMLLCRKKMISQDGGKLPFKTIIPIIIFAAASDGISYMLQLIGATKLPATVLYPFVTGFSVFLTSLAGVIIFKEKLSSRQWIGVAVCFAGTLLFL